MPCDLAIPVVDIYTKDWKQSLKETFYAHVYSTTVHNSKTVEATQVSISRLMDKENLVYTYHWIFFNLKKEVNADTWYNMNGP